MDIVKFEKAKENRANYDAITQCINIIHLNPVSEMVIKTPNYDVTISNRTVLDRVSDTLRSMLVELNEEFEKL